MFNFWKPKPPEDFLSDVVKKLENMANYKKSFFLAKHLTAICRAMEQDPIALAPYNQPEQEEFETNEWTLGYMYWHGEVFDALLDEDDTELNTTLLSPAAQDFHDKTKADMIAAFDTIFKINPVSAISYLTPAMLFKTEIAEAMESLVHHENPQIYFDCFAAVDYCGDIADKSSLSQRLIHATSEALVNLLEKQPNSLLSAHSNPNPFGKTNYLFYLPEGLHRHRFITDNIDAIDVAVRAVAENADDNVFEAVTDLCDCYFDDTRPQELIDLKNLMLSERVKMCFRMAAGDDRNKLTSPVAALDGQATNLVVTFSQYPDEGTSDEPFTPTYELLRLTNPSVSADADDADNGVDSKYLWLLRKSDRILAAAFSKAGIAGYLGAQTQYAPSELPRFQRVEDFLYE